MLREVCLMREIFCTEYLSPAPDALKSFDKYFMQFGIAAHVAQVARHDDKIARRSVDLPNRRAQQGVGLPAGRHMDIGQKGEAQLRCIGQDMLRRTPGLQLRDREQCGSQQKKNSFHGVFFDTAR